MSRFEESKLLEHDERLDQISSDLKSLKKEKETSEKMVKIKVVAIEFSPDTYQIGEAQMNSLIASGWLIQKEFSRESGVVFVMSKWENKTKEDNK
tara:strand:- start:404 stop:688 length:285 start_codon:yes stop_codon:yes gene_type:complete